MKKYISEEIGEAFIAWGRRKVIIKAPTGAGKTTFLLKIIIPYIQKTRGKGFRLDKKVLIICNRKLLRKQYFYDLIMEFDNYEEMEAIIEIKTYQELAAEIKNSKALSFAEYRVICLDEVHYFVQDADFNGIGTYPLFVAIMKAGMDKQMIFLSATIDCIIPFIKEITYMSHRYWMSYYMEELCGFPSICDKECAEIIEATHNFEESYEYLRCICVPDEETLCQKIAESDGKSIIFIDDKKVAADFVAILENTGKVARKEICVLHADNLENDENNEIIKVLTMANKLLSKVLLTTSVLDNGVSVKDKDVKNIVIMTESETSFKQMLGRVRCECVEEKLTLYFVPRPAEYYERREKQYGRVMQKYKEIKRRTLQNCLTEIWESMFFGDVDEQALYRKFIIFFHQKLYIDDSDEMRRLSCKMGNMYFSVNPFAIQKISNAYMVASKFHKLARNGKFDVIYEQLQWIGLGKNDLQIEDSSYLERRKEEFLSKLLSVKEFTNKEFGEFKDAINNEFGKEFFRDIVSKRGSFETEKFKKILLRFDCELEESLGEDGKKRYSVIRKGRDCQ